MCFATAELDKPKRQYRMQALIRVQSSLWQESAAMAINSSITLDHPSTPELSGLQEYLEACAKERAYPEFEPWQEALDHYADRTAHGQPLRTLDTRLFDPLHRAMFDQIRFWSWPLWLFIPAAADFHRYWFTACPPNHRYARGWVSGSGANVASASDGHLFAYAASRPSDVSLRSQAGVGVLFTPRATLALYKVEATMTGVGNHRIFIDNLPPYSQGTSRVLGLIYTAAWDVSPVDGSLALVRPYGISPTVFDWSMQGQGGGPTMHVTPSWDPGPPASYLLLEGGHNYLIGVVAAVSIDNRWTDPGEQPFSSLPPGSTWLVWCSLDCLVDSIYIYASTVYHP
jgi:hypothetical protein